MSLQQCCTAVFARLQVSQPHLPILVVRYHRNELPGSQPVDMAKESDRRAVTDARYYFKYASGIYGWLVYSFDNICCCCCKLVSRCCVNNCCDGKCGGHSAMVGDTCTCNEVRSHPHELHWKDSGFVLMIARLMMLLLSCHYCLCVTGSAAVDSHFNAA
jgi:hypothetical protein